MGRDERRERWQKTFNPNILAGIGLAASSILVLSPGIYPRMAIFLVALLAAWFSGRKISPLMTIVVILGIVGANLLVPIGRVLWQLGSFRITETALLNGAERAITFEALVLISKATLNPTLRMPGKAGVFLAAALVFYEQILSLKSRLRIRTLIADIDDILNSVYHSVDTPIKNSDTGTPDPRAADTEGSA